MKKVMLFIGDNCPSCAKTKQEIKNDPIIKQRLDIQYINIDDDECYFNGEKLNGSKIARLFRDYQVTSIPVMFKVKDGKEIEGTRQGGNIDLSKY